MKRAMKTDAAPFWENLFLYSYEEGYMPSLISFDKQVFCESYKKEPEIKVEHQGEHATFFTLDITVKKEIFIYKLYDEKRLLSLFNCKNASYRKQYFLIFFSAIKGEFLRTGSTLCLSDFEPKAKDLL